MEELKKYDIIIVGAGPAGLSAAIYAERAGKHAAVFEGNMYGGQIVNTPEVANYPGIQSISGYDFAEGLYQQATSLGAEVLFEQVVGLEKKESFIVTTDAGTSYEADAVILATGAKNRHLGIEKEDRMVGRGVSYCATCDGAFFKGKDVVVNGGGNTAIEDAAFLSNYCSKVYVVHRRDTFRAEQSLVEGLRAKENVEFVLDSVVRDLQGETKLEGVVVENTKTGEGKTIPAAGLFIAIGQEPDNRPFAELAELDPTGYVRADESCLTGTEGLFTAGDCRTKQVRQLTTAVADGAVAALAACGYLNRR